MVIESTNSINLCVGPSKLIIIIMLCNMHVKKKKKTIILLKKEKEKVNHHYRGVSFLFSLWAVVAEN